MFGIYLENIIYQPKIKHVDDIYHAFQVLNVSDYCVYFGVDVLYISPFMAHSHF
jgi:lipoprotein signal peptidase